MNHKSSEQALLLTVPDYALEPPTCPLGSSARSSPGNDKHGAVSQDPQAAKVLMEPRQGQRAVSAPADPLWISLPGAALGSGERLPEGTRMFAQSMQNAEEITLSAGPQGQAYEVRLNVRCRSGQDAARLSEQLERTTALLRQMIQKESLGRNLMQGSRVFESMEST